MPLIMIPNKIVISSCNCTKSSALSWKTLSKTSARKDTKNPRLDIFFFKMPVCNISAVIEWTTLTTLFIIHLILEGEDFEVRASWCKKQCKHVTFRITACKQIIQPDWCPVCITTHFTEAILYLLVLPINVLFFSPVVFASNGVHNGISSVITFVATYLTNAINWAQFEVSVEISTCIFRYFEKLVLEYLLLCQLFFSDCVVWKQKLLLILQLLFPYSMFPPSR